MRLKVGKVCKACDKVLDEDDVLLMGGMKMNCSACGREVCHNCALFCPTDDCVYWCNACSRKCRVCERVGVECKGCFKEYKDDEDFKRVKRKMCGFCFSKCERCGRGGRKKKIMREVGHFCPKCDHVIRNE